MDEDKLFEIVRNAYNGVNTDYLKSQVLAAVAEIGLTRQQVMDGLLDWIVVGGCTGANDRYRPYIYGALALLKEQEARLMTLEELQAIETPWNRNTPPYLFVEGRSPTEARWMCWGFMHDFVRLPGTIGVQNYGSKWRVWNLQPSPEQMRETPWEGEEDHEA